MSERKLVAAKARRNNHPSKRISRHGVPAFCSTNTLRHELTCSSNTAPYPTRPTDHPSPLFPRRSRSIGARGICKHSHRTSANQQGKGIALPAELFNVEVRRDILHQCAVWWRASMRRVRVATSGADFRVLTERSAGVRLRSRRGRSGHRRRLVVRDWVRRDLQCVSGAHSTDRQR